MTAKTKTVNFFRVMILDPRTGDRVAQQIPWEERLTKWATRSMAEQVVTVQRSNGAPEDVLFHPDLTKPLPVATAHWAASPKFQTLISRDSAQIEDAAIAVEEGQELADSTAIAFLPAHNVFGIALGNQSSPRQGVVVQYLERALKALPGDQKWVIRPVVDEGNLAKFREQIGGGVESFEGSFSTAKDLLTPQERGHGFISSFDDLAERLGSDLKITIKVSLDEVGQQRMAPKREFRDALVDSLPRLVAGTRKAKVHTVSEDGTVEEIYNLLEERLSTKATVNSTVAEGSKFSALIDEVVRVSEAMGPRIEEILKG